ncbi:MAG TPA: hypothetical protein VEH29_02830 [Acidimicrobiales bacterium]|nr:hypothetical protein [Acidimicrobiales bacterium]
MSVCSDSAALGTLTATIISAPVVAATASRLATKTALTGILAASR